MAEKEHDYLLATEPWPPHFGPKLPDEGYFADIIYQAFQQVGKTAGILYTSWNRAFELGKKGKYDGLVGAFYAKEREKLFSYSKPISSSNLVFFQKKGEQISYNTLRDLSPYRIGTVRGYHYTDEFNKADYLQKLEEVHTERNINLLLIGRLDLIVAEEKVAQYLLKTKFKNKNLDVDILDKPLVTHKLFLMIPKESHKHDSVLADFNRGFSLLMQQGKVREIMKKHGWDVNESK
ncbi:transporter substrate-binding domain-containing protein [Endozoicomonas sp. SM1973]|uniref:Transporter substrate-binding domain-containing protein n=1 Tax=Spartinivicinus marinus TaxID=2994442 RepID=A0A853IIF7_9GAMM|nr:transporter substrate-binding domain-containing protein [Spartinivicinus marinus]MCX4027509.1 transporter substrate-binding domain-containing protein [Spartinivicinus marinus]NYZ68885.1 transporter substrate-binding domain-containing protein [Spartinivicinus marinus]